MALKDWVMTKAFHPIKYKKGIYIIDFWKKGTIKVDRNLRRYQIEARTITEAIRKAKIELKKDI